MMLTAVLLSCKRFIPEMFFSHWKFSLKLKRLKRIPLRFIKIAVVPPIFHCKRLKRCHRQLQQTLVIVQLIFLVSGGTLVTNCKFCKEKTV